MKKSFIYAAAAFALIACGGPKTQELVIGDVTWTGEATEVAMTPTTPNCPPYTVVNNPQVNIEDFPMDADGYYVIFNGNEKMQGWRGYGKDYIPARWSVEDGAIKFAGSGGGEAQTGEGGDLIFAHKFKNFMFEMEWKVSKGGNSGIFYMAQEVKSNGEYLPIWQSSSEYQVLDNENHIDAQLGVDGNRQSASLYDMIPAKPQNAKPFGEWNKVKIVVFKGTVIHYQNDEKVLEYHLWTPKWNEMLDNSKFNATGDFPIAYELLKNMGGEKREGYIGLQDHGDDVWYRNVRVKVQ